MNDSRAIIMASKRESLLSIAAVVMMSMALAQWPASAAAQTVNAEAKYSTDGATTYTTDAQSGTAAANADILYYANTTDPYARPTFRAHATAVAATRELAVAAAFNVGGAADVRATATWSQDILGTAGEIQSFNFVIPEAGIAFFNNNDGTGSVAGFYADIWLNGISVFHSDNWAVTTSIYPYDSIPSEPSELGLYVDGTVIDSAPTFKSTSYGGTYPSFNPSPVYPIGGTDEYRAAYTFASYSGSLDLLLQEGANTLVYELGAYAYWGCGECVSLAYVGDPFSLTTNPVPEPEIYAMLGMGLGLLSWVGRRKKLKEAATA